MPGKSGSRKCSEPTEFKDVVPTQLEFRTNGGENKGYTRLSVRSIREGKDRGIQGRRTQKRTLGQRWGVGPVLPGPSLCALRYIVLPSRQQGPGKAKEVPTARIVTSQTQTCLFSSPSHPSAIWATERGIAGANTTSEPPSHWHLCDTQRHSTHRCLGHWPNKEIQDKPAVLSWPHPAGRQKQWQRGMPCYVSWHLSGRDEIHHQSHPSEVVPHGIGGVQGLSWGNPIGPLQLLKEWKVAMLPFKLFTVTDRSCYEAVCQQYY